MGRVKEVRVRTADRPMAEYFGGVEKQMQRMAMKVRLH